ncbi:MAG: HAD family hydrolase [Gemmatimonadetes bacterium]|nr:HAD family hydrolase [Gemmatimonadota bacterium]
MPSARNLKAAVFLDRDGTLIYDRHYLKDPAGVELVPGAAEAVRRLRGAGFAVVVVTNQSGIGRGFLTWDDFRATQARLDELLAAHGTRLDGVYVCPHHPGVTGPCDCRKPAPGLFRRAAAELGLDLAQSFFVGDRWRDVEAAEVLGGTPVLLALQAEEVMRPPHIPVVSDLGAATDYILTRRAAPDKRAGEEPQTEREEGGDS